MFVIFATPEWRLTETLGKPYAQKYGYVNNQVSVTPWKGRAVVRYINVPTGLIALIDAVMPEKVRKVAWKEGTVFFLDQDENREWTFGFEANKTEYSMGLWNYSPKTVPDWLVAGTV